MILNIIVFIAIIGLLSVIILSIVEVILDLYYEKYRSFKYAMFYERYNLIFIRYLTNKIVFLFKKPKYKIGYMCRVDNEKLEIVTVYYNFKHRMFYYGLTQDSYIYLIAKESDIEIIITDDYRKDIIRDILK